ncbi:hypothetical protein SULPSESMR1_04675 (plasmid) [Pseudosulfitobacter pseudonitzschiae]|uniref:Uncharacterized protein n=1 Tax=Pseudosulfitobacter pseudonitzschiae TaxID=1402135 RepID=A0A221K685_9RHOB|nr:hypothetical protein SULPSESMR1_04675 [Pseudosulfitobacter pseudonitzschiae]
MLKPTYAIPVLPPRGGSRNGIAMCGRFLFSKVFLTS